MTPPDPGWDETAFRAAVQCVLEKFLAEQAGRLAPLGPDAALLVDEAGASVSGGKRLRAAFCYWGYHAVEPGRERDPQLLRAAAALELLHASALVHDDYMDASDVRRGRPATHRGFESAHRRRGWGGSPEQYGAAGAILVGDLLLSWSEELLRSCGIDRPALDEALRYFDATRSEVIAGQFLDVSAQARGVGDLETAMRVLRYKSAKYSVERPLQIGAALAGAGADVITALSGFGLPLGEAFQLRDDLLGVFGDPEVTGKPAGDDLREGKRTVLIALTLALASEEEGTRLEQRLGTTLTSTDVTALRRVIDGSGAAAEAERLIDELADRAVTALAAAPVTEQARSSLERLAVAATRRTG